MLRLVAAALAGGTASLVLFGSSGAYAALAAVPLGGSIAALLVAAAALHRTRDPVSESPHASQRG